MLERKTCRRRGKVHEEEDHTLHQKMKLMKQKPKDESRLDLQFNYFLLIFVLLSNNDLANVSAVIVENNPFYGLSSEKINTVESTTDDKLIKLN